VAGVDLFDDWILFRGIKVARPTDDTPNISLAVTPFRDEHLGRLPGRFQFSHVGFFQLAHQLAVGRAAQFIHRRQIDARPCVDDVFAVGGEIDGVSAIAFGHGDEARAVKVDAVIMHEVRVLSWILAGGSEPDLPFFFVNAVNAAHDIITCCDGGQSRRRGIFTIGKIEMTPAVALGDVNDLIGFFEPVDEVQVEVFDVSRPDERVAFLVDDVARLAGLGIDFNHTQALMSPIGLLVHEMSFVGAPIKTRPEPLMFQAIDFGFDLLLSRDIEKIDFVSRELIPWQRVGARLQFGATASRGEDSTR
jgi:hypothetical protein